MIRHYSTTVFRKLRDHPKMRVDLPEQFLPFQRQRREKAAADVLSRLRRSQKCAQENKILLHNSVGRRDTFLILAEREVVMHYRNAGRTRTGSRVRVTIW